MRKRPRVLLFPFLCTHHTQMIQKISTIATAFYAYQRERFPIILLGASLVPAILSSGAILSVHLTIEKALFTLIASLTYLFHIRVLDEDRDFQHDNLHHTKRPIQIGMISRKHLHFIDIFALTLLLIISIMAGLIPFVIALLMLAYSFLAKKEFFLGENLRRHFFIYNGINLVQMLLMQIFVYAVFENPFSFTTVLLAHFLFTTVGTIIFEFVRKIKSPGEDGTGKDTYTWHLGFQTSLSIYTLLLFLNITLFYWITTLILPYTPWLIASPLILFVITSLFTGIYWIKQTPRTNTLMQASLLLCYGMLNLSIYFLISP